MAEVSNLDVSRGLVTIYLDGGRWCAVKQMHFDLVPVEAGEEIEPDAYADRLAAIQMNDCYEAALTLLDRADRTRRDVAARLVRMGYVRPCAEACAQRLSESGLIDDERFARRVAQNEAAKATGYYAALRKLRAKQLDEGDIESAMRVFDDAQQSEACMKAARTLWRKYEALPAREARAKLSQALARRGFTWASISVAVEELTGDSPDGEDI